MNLQAYANHRKALGLRGTSHVAVLNAINDGRLSAPAVRKDGKYWVIDPALADGQWASRTDLTERGSMGIGTSRAPVAAAAKPKPAQLPGEALPKGGPSLADGKRVKALYDAKLAELEFKERVGELGSIEKMKREAFTLGKAVREGVLGIIPRLGADLAAMTDRFEIERRLEDELTTALRALADG
jgi:hypothetical protein